MARQVKKSNCSKNGGMAHVLYLFAALPADMFPEKRSDPPPQERPGLAELFDGKMKRKTSRGPRKHKKRV